jgi:3'(2'), 5'-bisphosphate nucleotidase
MEVAERGTKGQGDTRVCCGLRLDFETLLPTVDTLIELGMGFIAWQPKVIRVRKADGTPVSNADQTAQRIVTNWLKEVSPTIPVYGEEGPRCKGSRPSIYWIVDPIDSTRSYNAMRYEWCVAIALVMDGVPRVGIVLQPGRGEFAVAIEGKGVRSRTKYAPWQTLERLPVAYPMLSVPASKSVFENDMYKEQARDLTVFFEDTLNLPCVAAGFEVARGTAWAWASLFEPCEWDIAATYVLVREMGGVALCANGDPIPWGQDRIPSVIFAITTPEKVAAIAWMLSKREHAMRA